MKHHNLFISAGNGPREGYQVIYGSHPIEVTDSIGFPQSQFSLCYLINIYCPWAGLQELEPPGSSTSHHQHGPAWLGEELLAYA